MSRPFTSQAFIPKPLDPLQPRGAGQSADVLPLLVALEDLDRRPGKLSIDSPMLFDMPHIILDLD